jgi:pimeloyl-ACP methyl ester carboxylesterase
MLKRQDGAPLGGTSIVLKAVGALLFLSAIALWLSRAPDWPVEALVARWAPPPSMFIELNGQLVHLRDEGPRHAPVLVLLHGMGSSLHTWEGWATALRARRRIITLDLPGSGLSGSNASGDYRSESDARFVLDVLDRLGVQRFVVGGHALGGEVAWRIALLASQRVERLILVDAAGQRQALESVPLVLRAATLPLADRLFEYVLPRPVLVTLLHQAYGDPLLVSDSLIDRYQAMMLREGNRQALVQRLLQDMAGADSARIAELKLPTLLLWGGRDRLLPPKVARHFAEQISGSELVVFDNLGHMPHEEDAASSVAAARDFLLRE